MDNDNISNQNVNMTSEQTAEVTMPDNTISSHNHSGRRRCVVIGLLLVILAWVTMMMDPYVSLGCGIAGLIFSAVGVRIPPGPRRNFAITAIVAASVLILVFAIFAVVLSII